MDLHRPNRMFASYHSAMVYHMVASARVELKSDQAEKGQRVSWLAARDRCATWPFSVVRVRRDKLSRKL
jgi:hypothetical protein